MEKPTKEWLLKLVPCDDGLTFAESCQFDFTKIWQTCPRGDWLIWLLRKANLLDKPTSVRLAIEFAEHVLEHFEKKYPNDKRPRAAIEAARNWLDNPTAAAYAAYAADTAAASASAAYSAYADAAYADAAYAAAAYAAAAYAAYADAAYADADAAAAYAAAASASAAAASADAAYADAARAIERRWQANKIRELIPCPFSN